MQMLLVLLILIVLAILIVLDVRQKLDLGHPVFVLLTALGYFCSVVWTAALVLLALIETLDGGSLLVWVQAALSTLPGTLFGLYVLLRANLTPMHRKKVTPARRAVRLLDDGLIVGRPSRSWWWAAMCWPQWDSAACSRAPCGCCPFIPWCWRSCGPCCTWCSMWPS